MSPHPLFRASALDIEPSGQRRSLPQGARAGAETQHPGANFYAMSD